MKRTLAAAVALGTALTLGACGSDSGSGSTSSTSSSSNSSSPAAAGSSSSSSSSSSEVQSGDSVDFAAAMEKSSAATKDKKSAHMQMDLGSQGAMSGDVDYSSSSPAMSMDMKVSGQTMAFRYVDKVMYIGGDTFKAALGGKKWVKIDPNGNDALSKQMAPMLDQMASAFNNPVNQFAGMKDVKATVKSKDSSGTTYTVTLTKEQILAASKASGSDMLGADSASVPSEVTYDITIDNNDLPTHIVTEVSGQKMDITMSKWGEPVNITAPPASEVGSLNMNVPSS